MLVCDRPRLKTQVSDSQFTAIFYGIVVSENGTVAGKWGLVGICLLGTGITRTALYLKCPEVIY